MTVKNFTVSNGALLEHVIDYDEELIHLKFWNGQAVTLTFKEAKYLKHDWDITLTRSVVARNRSMKRRARVMSVPELMEGVAGD